MCSKCRPASWGASVGGQDVSVKKTTDHLIDAGPLNSHSVISPANASAFSFGQEIIYLSYSWDVTDLSCRHVCMICSARFVVWLPRCATDASTNCRLSGWNFGQARAESEGLVGASGVVWTTGRVCLS